MDIKELRKTMMLAKKNDMEKSKILSMLLDTAQKMAKADGNREIGKNDILVAAKRELKMARQSQDAGIDTGKTISILEDYLPKTKSLEETKAIVEKLVSELPEKNPKAMGMIMGSLKKEYGDQIDMGVASQLVKEALTS